MSIQLSDKTNKNGIIQFIEREIGVDYGYISGNTTRLAEWIAEINLSHDNALSLIFNEAGGSSWQFDDRNHTKYPIIKTNLVSGQRDYSFFKDEQGNIILDIYRVAIADENGVFSDIKRVDQQTPNNVNVDTTNYIDGQNTSGTPATFDLTDRSLFLDPIPDYNYTEGILMYINREGSYFQTSDTTKTPGIAGLYHEWYVLDPVSRYASRNILQNEVSILRRRDALEKQMLTSYGLRGRDEERNMRPSIESSR